MPETQFVTNALEHVYDSESHAIITMDIVHERIHEGIHYSANYSATKNAGQSLDFAIVVPASTAIEYHFNFDISTSGSGIAYFYKEATLTNNGTALNEYNLNRRSTNITLLEAYHTPTVGATGDVLWSQIINATGSVKSGGNTGSRFEYILKPDRKYLIRFTADGNATVIHINTYWYELTEE